MKKIRNFKITMLCRMLILALMVVPVSTMVVPMVAHAADDPAAFDTNRDGKLQVTEIDAYMGGKNAGLNAGYAQLIAIAENNLVGNNLRNTLLWTDTEVNLAIGFWGSFKMLGACLGIMYFLLEMNHAVFLAQSNWTIQSLMTPIIKFGIVMVVISYGDRFVSSILSFGNWWIGTQTDPGVFEAGMSYGMASAIKKLGFLEVIMMFMPGVLMILVSFLVSLIFVYKAFAYKLEVLVRVAITPVVFGDVWDGRNSHAVRWLKKLAGLMLYGGMFILIMRLGFDLNMATMIDTMKSGDGTLNTSFGAAAKSSIGGAWALLKGTLYAFLIPIAEIGALSLAKSACMEVFG